MTTPPLDPVAMTAEVAQALRAPFPPEKIGKRPKVTCKNCTQNKGTCNQHPCKQECKTCGAWITPAHIHLDFVGHADTTDRLLQVDPYWNWEPVAFDQNGLPLLDANGGLWIRLTIAGVTRLGYGDADGKRGPSAVKEAIGDAIRNAAMRFGVALDLWRKEPANEDDDRGIQNHTQRHTQHAQVTDTNLLKEILTSIANAETWPELSKIGCKIDAEIAAGRITPAEQDAIRKAFMPKRERFQRAQQPTPAPAPATSTA